jgi:hypothetical protein
MANCHTTKNGAPCYMAWVAKPVVKGTSRSPTPAWTPTSGSNWNSNFGFSSSHGDIINFSNMDGSVRTLRMFGHFTSATSGGATYLGYQQLAGRADGQTYNGLLN